MAIWPRLKESVQPAVLQGGHRAIPFPPSTFRREAKKSAYKVGSLWSSKQRGERKFSGMRSRVLFESRWRVEIFEEEEERRNTCTDRGVYKLLLRELRENEESEEYLKRER